MNRDDEEKYMRQNNMLPDETIRARSLRDKKRDVMVHVAVTIMPRHKNIKVIGEDENEIGQWAADIPAPKTPMTKAQFAAMMNELAASAYLRMRSFGLIVE
jgi:ribosomal protein L6P/L9E